MSRYFASIFLHEPLTFYVTEYTLLETVVRTSVKETIFIVYPAIPFLSVIVVAAAD